MSKRNVIHHSCLPSKFPLASLGVLTMALDQYVDMPGWAWGVYGTICGLLLVGCISSALKETQRPLPGYGERPGQEKS